MIEGGSYLHPRNWCRLCQEGLHNTHCLVGFGTGSGDKFVHAYCFEKWEYQRALAERTGK